MKNILTALLFITTLAACNKKTNPVTPGTPGQPSNPSNPGNPNPVTKNTSRFIPNWQQDTLIGIFIDANNDFMYDPKTGDYLYDTIITHSINDTSFITHQGAKYYLWWNSMHVTDTFVNNDNIYVNCSISTTRDTTGEVNTYNVSASPHRYWNDFYNTWTLQRQTLMGHNFSKKYKVSNSFYQSIKR